MTDAELIRFLDRFGHLRFPFGKPQDVPDDISKLTLQDKCVIEAVRSHQSLDLNYEWKVGREHGRALIADGDVGPASRSMMSEEETPRCKVADYGPESGHGIQAATGRGSWPAGWYDEYPNNHATTVRIVKDNMPSHLRPVYEEVFANSASAAAEFGWKWIRVDERDERANITIRFERGNGWIGLAIVPNRFPPGLKIWAKIDTVYQPAALIREHTTLLSHEVGLHNSGRAHTRGGKGNPSIIAGLPTSWRNDPAWPGFVDRFGGKPVDDTPAGWTVSVPGPMPNDYKWPQNGSVIKPNGAVLEIPIEHNGQLRKAILREGVIV